MIAEMSYTPALVAFSFLIAAIASYVAIEFSERARTMEGAAILPWLAAATMTMALGIWTAHHIGMLALDLDIWIWYSVPGTIASLAPAIILVGGAFISYDAGRNSLVLQGISAAAMASAIIAAQVTGFMSIRTGGVVQAEIVSGVTAAVVAFLLCLAGLRTAHRLAELQPFETRTVLYRGGAAVLLGLAICANHYITLSGMQFTGGATGWRPGSEQAWGTTALGIAVALTTMVILAIAVGMSEIDRWRLGRLVAEESIRRSERRVIQSERRFQSLIEHSADFIAIVDRFAIVQYASPGYSRLFGDEPLERRDFVRFVHPDDRAHFEEQVAGLSAQTTGAREIFEYRVKGLEGEWRHLSTDATNLIEDPGVEGIVLNSRDVTDRQSLENQLRQSQKMDAIGRLAAGVAHDFNNLLTVISSSSEFLVEDLRDNPRLQMDAIEIQRASDRAAGLTRQLLAFSRKQQLNPQPLDLSEVVSSMLPMISRVIGEDIEIVTRQNSRGIRMLADQGQIEQVILNLVVNARDAMPGGGVLVFETCILPKCPALEIRGIEGPYVSLQVRDTGLGMKDDVRNQIFDPFFTTKEREKGTGLGLSTVYGIVRQSEGHIHCLSEPGRGTTFTLTFPSTSRLLENPATQRMSEISASGQVLLVEDEADVRRVTRRVLERIGYDVIEAASGDEGLALAEKNRSTLRLIVSDVIMPGLDGPSMVRILRARMPEIPVLFVSGYSGQELQRRHLELEGPHLAKPFSEQELAKAAAAAVQLRTQA